MMMKKWKVCGLRDPENIKQIIRLKPDMLGFIFYPKSPRYAADLDPVFIRSLSGPSKVGVFVNASEREMVDIGTDYGLDTLQLHGQETPEQCWLMREAGFQVIKAISVGEKAPELDVYAEAVDLFLFDTKGKLPGGNGKTFDWSQLHAYARSTPFLLSGGLTPQNLSAALKLDHPAFLGVDLNSGFELSPGLKDPDLMKKVPDLLKKHHQESFSNL